MIKIKVITGSEIAKIVGAHEKIIYLPEGATVNDFLTYLKTEYGEPMEKFLFKSNRELSQVVMVNGKNIAFLEGKDTKLKDGDEIFLVPIAAGG
ncbi:molybdopterin synthase sulfur carrier subunit [Caldanaerovirga acetigignens]|uniref:Molybdopterin synthase sulfur carrier subunit n=1 Tax=Caldanaerovirga acetigignens TaxID=447595 RepID=A0A1M7HH22_9FIRM|nr:MoaD/ThiS family protein [Caldanaerovirga acetigignens]SHM27754.1 molybdopterin synthase sulfur carrier subunit [Caldanaerovirga acetigignens]